MHKTAQTPQQRKAVERSRKRSKGLVQVQVWIKGEHKEKLLQFVEGVNKK